ncbi:protein mono-ADP-ribosyltransferase PARP9 isoform 1-T2 [Mantella aurantiaca]
MEITRQIPLSESTYRHLLGCKDEITDLCLRKFSCEVELRGPKLSGDQAASVAASVKPEIVYERTWRDHVVSVWKDDLTRQDADVVVNAANESLDHAGGLARALVEAGGPMIEKESKDYIKSKGELKTGDYAVTSSGRLPCKRLLHAVGPVWFSETANKCDLELAQCIRNVFNYLKQHKDMKSVAIPAVSSGIFGFPLHQCAHIIVDTIRSCSFNLTHPVEIRLVNNNDPAVQAMKSACERIFGLSDDLSGATSASGNQTRPTTRSMTSKTQPSSTAPSNKTAPLQPSTSSSNSEMSQSITINGLTLHLIYGLIQEQKTKIIVNSVSPTLDVYSGVISNAIASKAGYKLQDEIRKKSSYLRTVNSSTYINMIPTKGYDLSCAFVYHVILTFVHSSSYEFALQILNSVTFQCMCTAHKYDSRSISFPALGTGLVGLSKQDVAKVMTETVLMFARGNQCQLDVYFVIHPSDKDTYQAFLDQLNISRALMNTGATVERRDTKPDIHNKSSDPQDVDTPCIFINATSNEDDEEVMAWLNYILHPQLVSIQNNLVLLLGQDEHDVFSSPDFPDVSIEEILSNGTSELKFHGPPQDKVKAVIQVERLLLDVQEKHGVTLEEELIEAAVIWFYVNERGAWRYPAKANRELEKAFVTQRDIELQSEPYHMISMKKNMAEGKNGKFQLQRRTIRNSSKGVQKGRNPDDWLAQIVVVDPNSQEFSDCANKFKKEKLTLVKMEKIQNRYLSDIFQSKKEAKPINKKTCHLYQLVPRQFTRLICNVGFQRIFSNPKDAKYGEGIYFTDIPRRALECFQTPTEKSAPVYIFQAEVLMDSSAEGGRDAPILISKNPAYTSKSKDADILDLCDSLVNSKISQSICVLPDSFQANPVCLYTCRR